MNTLKLELELKLKRDAGSPPVDEARAVHRRRDVARLLCALAAASGAMTATADEKRSAAVPLLPAYKQECAACHVPYAPGLLPASSWQRLMSNLPQHFGTDASLDPATVQQLSGWLSAHAADAGRRGAPPPEDRITRSAWFVREHREIARAVWTRPSVRNASNCAACHGGASEGVFDEHDVRIPR